MEYFDIYLPIGPACRPANYLKTNGLRIEAYPLDWQMSYSLDTVNHLFETNFDDFFVNIIEEDNNWPTNENRRIKDTLNHIVSLHHFSKKMDIQEAQTIFLEKMRKRYKTLNRRLKRKKSLLMICNRNDSREKFKSFLLRFSKMYPNLRIRLLNVRTNENADSTFCSKEEFVIDEQLSFVEYCFNDTIDPNTGEKFDWKGNQLMWNDMLKDYNSKNIVVQINKMKSNKSKLISGVGKVGAIIIDAYDRIIDNY